MFFEITLLFFCRNDSAFSIYFSFSKLGAHISVALTISIKDSFLLQGTNLGPRFRSSRWCWGISWFFKFKAAGVCKNLLPVIFCVLFLLVKIWYFSVRWFFFLTYYFSFDIFVMRPMVSKWASLNMLLNSCNKSFTSMLQFRNLCLTSFLAKTNNYFQYSLVMQVAFCDLIGGLILNDFRVTSYVKHFSKTINCFFDTAALIFLCCISLVIL